MLIEFTMEKLYCKVVHKLPRPQHNIPCMECDKDHEFSMVSEMWHGLRSVHSMLLESLTYCPGELEGTFNREIEVRKW